MDPVLQGGRSRPLCVAGGSMTFDGLKALVRSIQTRKRLDDDMDDEMRFHIQEYERDLVRRGLPAPEAARRARNEFGNISSAKEECREVKGVPILDEFVRDIGDAFRQLRRSRLIVNTVTPPPALGI